jgi:hypothetical protein
MRVGYQGDEEVSIVSQAGVEERKNTKKGWITKNIFTMDPFIKYV